ncbi:D-inositol-3-phosphate glycosyltransferase [Microlunatus sagamiharensis]|uniref:D-inositol-3-phosphate glycosyltransferase n=1 Tax=Microlunatus sagamiharensis TaxID=546874 RepID=A0A1H2MT83_9ACTN|nr:D-inositol-3-phosphate glycosyltransferase [Microlunatus sagamiharensis]SDU96168.1 D-inositol-3-phosphate glycosyltransferase [Microlunatus sagamiharensis]
MDVSVDYPRRVAMVSLHTSPLATPGVGDAGGLNVYVAEVARRLAERGLHVDVFTRDDGTAPAEVVEVDDNLRVLHVPAGPRGPVAKEDLPDLVPEFSDRLESVASAYDLVHSHYWLSGMVGLALRRSHGLPLVHTMHTMARVKNGSRPSGGVTEPDLRALGESQVVSGAEVLTANTEDEAADLVRAYGARPDQVSVVPPGVDLHTFHPCDQQESRELLGVAQDAQVVLFVGRIQPLKAPDVLIRAVARLLEREPARRRHLRLIVIGSASGPDAGWSGTLAPLAEQLGVGDVVEFRPHAERSELFRYYCVSDVVGVPSYSESFGLVALEAQACGRPVVATDVGGLRHAVRDSHTGRLVDGHDPDDWADMLAEVLDHPAERVRLGANAAAHASRFSWSTTAAATLEAYGDALRVARRRSFITGAWFERGR